jgi:hypothetical protein
VLRRDTGGFGKRYLHDDLDWQRDIRPSVENFLREKVVRSPMLRLILDPMHRSP